MTRRSFFALSIATIVCAWLMGSAGYADRQGAGHAPSSRPLGSVIVPPTLSTLVELTHAAVVATIGAAGNQETRSDINPKGKLLATDVVSSYQLYVSDVLYNSMGSDGPPLVPKTNIAVTQYLYDGGERQVVEPPVTSGDECVLFLWTKQGSNEWSMIQWPLQFRRTTSNGVAVAVPVQPLANGQTLLSQKWLGASVGVIPIDNVQAAPNWGNFVEAVRRLGMTKGKL